MIKRRWHDYDDGFDEARLHEDEYIELESSERRPAVKTRPRLRAVRRKPYRSENFEDEGQRQRGARVKAWGVPY